MNSDWPQRVFIATSKHFQAIADAYPVVLHIEGTHYAPESKYLEFRLDGPTVNKFNNNYYELDFMVEIMWSITITHEDFHEPQRLIGLVTEAMTNICVYNEDDSFLGTLVLQNPIKTANYGQVNVDTKILQGTVFVDYRICLTE